MIFQLSLTNPPQVLKEGDHPSFQLKQAKKIDKERGHVDASMKGAQHVKLRGSDSLLKKIQFESQILALFEEPSVQWMDSQSKVL